jgi:hypothetical protein
MKRKVHVEPTDGTWKVVRGGTKLSTHKTQRAAIEAGRREARKDGVDLITYDHKGRLKSKDTFTVYVPCCYGNVQAFRDALPHRADSSLLINFS